MALCLGRLQKDVQPGDVIMIGTYEFFADEEMSIGDLLEVNPENGRLRRGTL